MLTMLFSLLGLGGVGGIAMLILRPALRATVGGFARSIPGWVWKAAAALLLIGGLYWWHSSAVSSAYERGETAGKAAQDAKWQIAVKEWKRAALLWKRNYETEADQNAALLRGQHDQNLRDIAARADDLRLRGPGNIAACPGRRGNPGVSGGSGGQVASAAEPDAPRDPVRDEEPMAIVPWGWLIGRAEEHDALLDEVKTWRTWHDSQQALHDAAVKRLRAEFPEPEFGK